MFVKLCLWLWGRSKFLSLLHLKKDILFYFIFYCCCFGDDGDTDSFNLILKVTGKYLGGWVGGGWWSCSCQTLMLNSLRFQLKSLNCVHHDNLYWTLYDIYIYIYIYIYSAYHIWWPWPKVKGALVLVMSNWNLQFLNKDAAIAGMQKWDV